MRSKSWQISQVLMLHIRKIAAANFLKNFCRKDLLFLLSSFHIATFNVKIRWPFHHSRGLKFARINFWYDTIQKPNELMKGRASEWKDLILYLSAILIKCNVGELCSINKCHCSVKRWNQITRCCGESIFLR